MKESNTFFDINHFPEGEGLLLSGISMNRIANSQSPEACFAYLQHIDTKIVKTKGIGMITLYSDYLYFQSDESAKQLRDRYKNLMLQHKNGLLNILTKDTSWIRKAFSFYTFGQMMLDNAEVFESALGKIVMLYDKDTVFRECVAFDSKQSSHGIGNNEIMFILEEITFFYLAAKAKLVFNNHFVTNPDWILNIYPGKPLKSEVYLFQSNPLELSCPKNKYENCYYDLAGRKLYEYNHLDLETFDFKS